MLASSFTLILGSTEDASVCGFLPGEVAAQYNPDCKKLAIVPFIYRDVYKNFLRSLNIDYLNLGNNGFLFRKFIPRELIENNSVVILYYSSEMIPDGNRIGLQKPKLELFKNNVGDYETLTEGSYVKLVPKTPFELIPTGVTLMEKANWIRTKLRHQYLQFLFHLFYTAQLPNFQLIMDHVEKLATNVTHLECGLMELLLLRLLPLQIIPELQALPFLHDESKIFKAFGEILGLSKQELKVALTGREVYNYIDLVYSGTTFKDNFKAPNMYLWNLIHGEYKPSKFPYNWIDQSRNYYDKGSKGSEDFIEIEKLIRWNMSDKKEEDFRAINSSSIELHKLKGLKWTPKVPITWYKEMKLDPAPGDTMLIDHSDGFELDGMKHKLNHTEPPIFRIWK